MAMAVPISTIHYRTYTETGNSNQNSGFCHFILTRNPANWLVGVSPELSTIHYQLSTLITMLRKFLVLLMCLTLCWTTSACGSSSSTQSQPQAQQNAPAPVSKPLSDGEYPVQQATYNDADGSYSLFLLNTPSGTPPVYNTVDLQMAQLTSEDIEAGKKTYLKVENGQQAMYMKEDFRIEYVHNVTETRTDPQTGQAQTVVVRQESSFWAPFAGAIAGQAIGSLLFRPQYYVPPVYQPGGGILTGYGGYGNTYNSAVQSYQDRYQQPPAAVKNRQTLRTTSNLRNTSSSTTRKNSNGGSRATGSGVGSSTLKQSGNSTRTKRPSSGFGSGRSRSRSRGRRR